MTQFPDDEDGQVLQELAAQGIDLSMPRSIDFIIAAPHEQSSRDIAAALVQQGYQPEVEFDEGEPEEGEDEFDEEFGPSWTIYVPVEIIPTHERILQLQEEFNRLAQPLGGFADGWGMMVDPEE